MFSKKFLLSSLLAVVFTFLTSDANAITINGEEYKEILSVKTGGGQDFGYWSGPLKFFTFKSNDNYIVPININKTDYRDPTLNGVNFSQVLATGASNAWTTNGNTLNADVAMSSVVLYGPGNQILLQATYVDSGEVNATFAGGYAGQLNVNGIYNVTGGSLFTAGLITDSLYINIAFDYVWQNKFADLKTTNGSFTFYQGAGGVTPPNPNPIPEPTSVALLTGGLVGLVRKRRKGLAKS